MPPLFNSSVTNPVSRSFVLLCCSTVSSSINALVAVTVEDFIVTNFKGLSDKQLKWLNMGLSKSLYCVAFNKTSFMSFMFSFSKGNYMVKLKSFSSG